VVTSAVVANRQSFVTRFVTGTEERPVINPIAQTASQTLQHLFANFGAAAFLNSTIMQVPMPRMSCQPEAVLRFSLVNIDATDAITNVFHELRWRPSGF
jgi:hypothetical protein